MLAKINRLQKEKDFKRVYARGKTAQGTCLTLKHILTPGVEPRVGIVLSKKISKKATVRNRCKRLVREAMRHKQGQLKSSDIIIIVNRLPQRPQTAKQIQGDLEQCLKKASLI